MTLDLKKSGSWRARWNHGGKPFRVTLGSSKSIKRADAQKMHDMIMSLFAVRVINDETYDSKQTLWLKKCDDKLHARLEKIGLARERAARRSVSDFTLESVCQDFLTFKESIVVPKTLAKYRQAFIGLQRQFGKSKDIRDITPNEAKNYPRNLKKQGNRHGKTYADSTVAKQIGQIKELFRWAGSEGIVQVDVFAYGVKCRKKPIEIRNHYVTLEETQELFNCQYTLQSLARIVLARLMGLRGASDTLWIRNRDVNFADGDVNRATVTIDSHKNGGRICPMFHDANWIIFKLLCDAEPNPDGYLFKGEKEDAVRAGEADCDFSLSEQYAGRYTASTGKSRIPKLFHNCRSSWVTELVKVFGINKHDCAKWIGHTEAIQDSNYLQMISEDIHQAMDDAMSQEKGAKKGATYTGSHWFELLHTALQTNHPELAEAALEHTQNITKIGMRGLFRIPSVDIASHSTTSLAEVLSSEGGTIRQSVSNSKYRVGKVHAEKRGQLRGQPKSIGPVTPTLLATIWNDLCEAEQSNVNQIIVDYLQSQTSEIVDAQN